MDEQVDKSRTHVLYVSHNAFAIPIGISRDLGPEDHMDQIYENIQHVGENITSERVGVHDNLLSEEWF